jgi:putative ABC transport system permease protein
MKFLPLIWSGFRRKPGSTLLMFLQILVAFVIFGLLQGLYGGVNELITKMSADNLDVQSRGTHDPLPIAYRNKLQQIPGVSVVGFNNYLNGYFQNQKQPVFVIATDPKAFLSLRRKLETDGSNLDAMERKKGGVIVGETLAKRYGWKVGDTIPIHTSVQQTTGVTTWAFDIVGTFTIRDAAGLDNFVVANNSYLNDLRATNRDKVTIYTLRVSDPAQASAIADSIDRAFANSDHETQTDQDRDLAQSQLASFGNLNFIVNAVTLASLIALLFSVFALMMKSFRERYSEFAILKAMGFSNGKVAYLVLAESFLLFIAGTLCGLLIARALFPLANRYTEDFGAISLPLSVICTAVLLALSIALACAALPAWRGFKLSVVDALADR